MVPERPVSCDIGVLVDVLRATSTIVTALANGATCVRPVSSVEEALEMKGEGVLVCGERGARKPEGFDLGNSPLEYTKDRVEGKKIVLTTSNGTVTLEKMKCEEIVAACFLNLTAVVEYLQDKENILIVCAGTNGKFSLEDFLLAGAIVRKLKRPDASDFAHVARKYFESVTDLLEEVKKSSHARYLMKLGFERDVEFCCKVDSFKVVPVLREKCFVPLNR